MQRLLILFLALSLLAPRAFSQDLVDRLVLNDGKEIECRVLFEDDERVVVQEKRKEASYPREEVREIVSIERSLREFLDRFAEVDRSDTRALHALAEFAEERDLPGEARNMWIRILTIDGDDEAAWRRLGGQYSKSRGWRIKVRGRYLDMQSLRDRVADWKNAMELTTAHFLLRTDVSPEVALDLTIDMERAYFEFYDMFSDTLDLYVFFEKPEINVYADADEYPPPILDGQEAWFSTPDNQMFVNGEALAVSPVEALRHFSDLLMFTFFTRTYGPDGFVTPFVSRGLGELFGAAFRHDAGRSTWEFGEPDPTHFRTHAAAGEPLPLRTVLNGSLDDFVSGDKTERMVAQAYTLVHFLVFADNSAYRQRAAEFLKDAFVGKSSSSHFEDLFGEDLAALEERWIAYVQEIAAGF